jgi:hypothetical protein
MALTKRFCARCRVEIPAERIEALPDTRLCVTCSQAVGGEYEVTAVPDNLGKTGSLKKNYAAWTIRKRRRRLDLDNS